jgi:hypothetical protein
MNEEQERYIQQARRRLFIGMGIAAAVLIGWGIWRRVQEVRTEGTGELIEDLIIAGIFLAFLLVIAIGAGLYLLRVTRVYRRLKDVDLSPDEPLTAEED